MRLFAKSRAFPAFATALLSVVSLRAADTESVNLWTGENVRIGGIFMPKLSLMTAVGSSSAPDGALAAGHHDPDRDGITLQNAELALTAQFGPNFSAFAVYAAKVDLEDHWSDEFEEYYFTLDGLPAELRLKAGKFYAQFGFQNSLHPHDFTFADQYLANGRLLGEDAATIVGAELSLPLFSQLPRGWSDRLTVAFGAVPDGHEEHHHGHETEAGFESERSAFNDVLGTAEYRLKLAASDTVQYQFGVSGAWLREAEVAAEQAPRIGPENRMIDIGQQRVRPIAGDVRH